MNVTPRNDQQTSRDRRLVILRVKHSKNFTMITNTTIDDDRLSFRALGILVRCLSKPDHWETNVNELARGECREGRDAIETALRELECYGYLRRTRLRKPNGQWHWVSEISERPMTSTQSPARDAVAEYPPEPEQQPVLDSPPSPVENISNGGEPCPGNPETVSQGIYQGLNSKDYPYIPTEWGLKNQSSDLGRRTNDSNSRHLGRNPRTLRRRAQRRVNLPNLVGTFIRDLDLKESLLECQRLYGDDPELMKEARDLLEEKFGRREAVYEESII